MEYIFRELRWQTARLLHLSAPLLLQTLIACGLGMIGSAMVGNLNDPAMLSGYILAFSAFNTLGYSALVGVGTALDTLCGQAYGAKNYPLLGLSLQRCILISWTLCCGISAIFFSSETLLLALGQQPVVAHHAAVILHHIVPALFLIAVSNAINRYLMAQQLVLAAMIAALLQLLLAPIPYYLLIHRYGFGLVGAAWAFNAVSGVYVLLLLACVTYHTCRCPDPKQQAWAGWSWQALTGWLEFMKLGLPGLVMTCLEWWTFEIIIFMAGMVPDGEVAQGAVGITMQLSYWMYCFPGGLGSAAGVVVANEVGAGHADSAKHALRTAVLLTFFQQLAIGCLYLTVLPRLGALFSGNHEVRQMVMQLVPLLALYVHADGWLSVLLCVMRAVGHQRTGSLIGLLCCWAIALPSMALLAFTAGLGAKGFFFGLALAVNIETLLAGIWAARVDWNEEVKRSRQLVGSQDVDDNDEDDEEEEVQLLEKGERIANTGCDLDTIQVPDQNELKLMKDTAKNFEHTPRYMLTEQVELAAVHFTLEDDEHLGR